jgi:hypothetical protein
MKKNLILSLLALIVFTTINSEIDAQNASDTISFETPTSKIIIDSISSDVWQIGSPAKIFFNAAHSGEKAILTDTVSNYTNNDTTSFIYVIRNPYTQTCATSMEFWHKYDIDTLTEKGIIDASYDGGKSWVIVSDTMGSFWDFGFWWDFDYHASSGESSVHPLTVLGRSDGWILSRFSWQWWFPVKSDTIIINPDSLMIRFTFISDSIETNKEGWMIDDIVTTSVNINLCSGIEENNTSYQISISPNPFSWQAALSTDYPLRNATITIYNCYGQKVKTIKNIMESPVILFRDNLPSGIYFLVIDSDKNPVLQKFVLE